MNTNLYTTSLLQLTLYGMVLVFSADFILNILGIPFSLMSSFYFDRYLIMSGQIWRAFSFPFVYLSGTGFLDIIWFGFAMLIYNVVIRTLEGNVGRSRANLFAVLCWLTLLAYGLFAGSHVDFRPVILGITALAGIYNPNFTIYLYFFIPIRGIVLGILGLALMAYFGLFQGSYEYLLILALLALLNLEAIRDYFTGKQRRRAFQSKVKPQTMEKAPRHRCTQCGRTEKDAPDMLFRYCSKCEGSLEYCEEHIQNHEHRSNVIPLERSKTE